jgi:hypothetical protein
MRRQLQDLSEWHTVFAWFPVTTIDGQRVWLSASNAVFGAAHGSIIISTTDCRSPQHDPSPPSKPTRAAIEGLNEAQIEALLNPEWRGSGVTQFALVECLVGLAGPLAHMFTLRWDRLTPFGHEVRRELIAARAASEEADHG